MAGKERGKGGNWETRPNPFAAVKSVGVAPSIGDVPGAGLAFDKVLATGCALMLGYTRDGGALVLTVLDGTERHRTYCSSDVELEEAIKALSFVYEP